MTDIGRLIEHVIALEGGFSDHPADRGGATRWGITETVARASGYDGAMEQLPRSVAKSIYEQRFWREPGLEKLAAIAPQLAAELFDAAVNMGPNTAIKMLQRLLNGLAPARSGTPPLVLDGQLGSQTMGAVAALVARRGRHAELVLIQGFDSLKGERYVRLCELRPANRAFLYGWLAHRTRPARAS